VSKEVDRAYKDYFDSMPCFLTVQDRDLNIIDANVRFQKEFGEFKGRRCYQVYKNRPDRCEVCPVDRTFHDGQCHQSEEWVTTLYGKDVWVIVNTTPIFNDKGEVIAVMEMSTDITENKLLQRRLKESKQSYRLLFEEVPCFISIQDRDLRIVEANRFHREAFGTGYGSKCYEVYKHRDKECVPCIVRQTFEDGEIRTHEEIVTSRDNEQINVLVCTAPIRDANGTIEKVVEMSADITRVKELQDQLSVVGLLIGSISHGIKGLLNGLDGGIYLVNTGLKNDDRERIDRGWEMALRNVDRIRSMVMDILYYAKDREPEPEPIMASDLIDNICKVFEDKAKKLDVVCQLNIDPKAGEFEADRTSVRSMFMNLLENSLDACRIDTQKSEHKVSVDIKGYPDEVVFMVSDNGVGMSQETREKAFSLFFSSKGAGGTGLGLFIANKIAKVHGGSIEIESEEGKGSCFIVKMPRKCLVNTKKVDVVE
jgi:PAS domain S-box-containing protein